MRQTLGLWFLIFPYLVFPLCFQSIATTNSSGRRQGCERLRWEGMVWVQRQAGGTITLFFVVVLLSFCFSVINWLYTDDISSEILNVDNCLWFPMCRAESAVPNFLFHLFRARSWSVLSHPQHRKIIAHSLMRLSEIMLEILHSEAISGNSSTAQERGIFKQALPRARKYLYANVSAYAFQLPVISDGYLGTHPFLLLPGVDCCLLKPLQVQGFLWDCRSQIRCERCSFTAAPVHINPILTHFFQLKLRIRTSF